MLAFIRVFITGLDDRFSSWIDNHAHYVTFLGKQKILISLGPHARDHENQP
jgi:hypothetical protein